MATEVTATALFAGPDRGTLENVVLRHDDGIITSIEPSAAPPPARAHLRHPRFRQRPRPRPPDRVLVRRRRHAAGKLDPPLRLRHPARRLPRRRLRDGALGPIRLRRHDDPLHPAERQTAAGRGDKRDRPRRQRCRHPHRLCARGARPEPGRLRRQRAGVVRALRRAPQRRSRNCSSAPRCRRATTSN